MKEKWDAYDCNFNKLDITLTRGESIPDEVYHLVCDIAVKHIDGTFLLMQRDKRKHLAGMWELTAGGSALSGENALECAIRELREETGIIATEIQEIGRVIDKERHSLYVEFLCITDCEKNSIILQEGETIDFNWVDVKALNDIKNTLASTRILKFLQGIIL